MKQSFPPSLDVLKRRRRADNDNNDNSFRANRLNLRLATKKRRGIRREEEEERYGKRGGKEKVAIQRRRRWFPEESRIDNRRKERDNRARWTAKRRTGP